MEGREAAVQHTPMCQFFCLPHVVAGERGSCHVEVFHGSGKYARATPYRVTQCSLPQVRCAVHNIKYGGGVGLKKGWVHEKIAKLQAACAKWSAAWSVLWPTIDIKG